LKLTYGEEVTNSLISIDIRESVINLFRFLDPIRVISFKETISSFTTIVKKVLFAKGNSLNYNLI
jgi:hypothetical protein